MFLERAEWVRQWLDTEQEPDTEEMWLAYGEGRRLAGRTAVVWIVYAISEAAAGVTVVSFASLGSWRTGLGRWDPAVPLASVFIEPDPLPGPMPVWPFEDSHPGTTGSALRLRKAGCASDDADHSRIHDFPSSALPAEPGSWGRCGWQGDRPLCS
jgi:hypothetical protein